MAIALETVVKQLIDSSIISAGKLEDFVPPKATPKDGEELLRQLIKQNLLTRFQAQQCAQGRGKALILGNYTLLDKIGAGGMGQVFKAEHRRMKRVVAIKMLPKALMSDAAAAARFQREVEAAAKLSHPNIAAAYDADEANGVHFFVMEYVEGSDLSALVKKSGPLSVAKALQCILQAARGLEFAHAQGVIHRDVKPANLLLDKTGRIKVLDMGLARVDAPGGDGDRPSELTGTGAVMGTVDYMAPEQALNTRRADARSDVYSLGCTLCYLITGNPMYSGESVVEKLVAHREQPIPALVVAQVAVPKPVEAVFRKMVAKNPDQRYQTMSEVVAAIQNCGNQQAIPTAQALPATNPAIAEITGVAEITAVDGELARITSRQGARTKPGRGKAKSGGKALMYGLAGAGIMGVAALAGAFWMLNKSGHDAAPATAAAKSSRPTADTAGAETLAAAKKPDVVPATDKPATAADTPEWIVELSKLPASEQLDVVARQMQQLNPGFDGKLTAHDSNARPVIEAGIVSSLGLDTDHVTDISPLRALPGLRALGCRGSAGGHGQLADLTPLSGLSLHDLRIASTQVSDLSPLRGMPLAHLDCSGTPVADLAPLAGMQLTFLDCNRSKVSDLSPLRGMALTSLFCSQINVSDLLPLVGMPLKTLDVGNTSVTDFSPLEGLPLENLYGNDTQVSDLTPLHACKNLKVLRIMATKTTPAGVTALQIALPHCKIEWNGPAQGAPLAAAPAPTGASVLAATAAPQPGSETPAEMKSEPADPSDPREPIPDAAARTNAEQLFRDVFKVDLTQSRQPEQKTALFEKIFKQVGTTADDPPSQYVMLQECLRLASETADFAALSRAITRLAEIFSVDRHEIWLEAVEKTVQKPRLPAVNKALAEAAQSHVDELVARDNYELAERFQNIATAAAQKAKDTAFLKSVVERGKTFASTRQDWQQRQEAIATLAKNSDDTAANLLVGRYLCFVKGDWPAGFGKLAKGADPTLRDLAQQSLADPQEAADQAELSEAWAKAADIAKKSVKADLQSGARYWLTKAEPGLTGLAKIKAEQRLKQWGGEPAIAKAKPRPAKRGRDYRAGRAASDRQAAEWVIVTGGKVGITLPGSADERTFTRGSALPAEDFTVTAIDLNLIPAIPEAEYANLEGLVHLRELHLRATSFDDEGLAHVKDLVELKVLGLAGSKVTDNGLIYLKDLKNLETLGLFNRPISLAGLQHLRNLTKLNDLHLSGAHITDECIPALQPFTQLRVLGLTHTPVTSAGLQRLQNFPLLTELLLPQSRLTDADLPTLYQFKKLKRLMLRGTKLSDEGKQKLQAALPQCKIQF